MEKKVEPGTCRIYYQKRDPVRKAEESEHEAGLELLKFGLQQYGIEPAEVQIETKEKGKPYLKGIGSFYFNISHCKDMVVCVIGEQEVGIDVEPIRRKIHSPSIISRVLGDSEKSKYETSDNKDLTFLQFWTLKESYVKYLGTGIVHDMNQYMFELHEDNGREMVYRCNKDTVCLKQWVLDEHVLSLCTQVEQEVVFIDCSTIL